MTTKKYDGCSGGMSKTWKWLFGTLPPWEGCCDKHDIAYAAGGTWFKRLEADIVLYECIYKRGYPTMARIMYHAVRIGGVPWTRLPWRWGFDTNRYSYAK